MQCWATILGVEICLVEFDRVVTLASQMAYGLEKHTSIEGSLMMDGLSLALVHITKALVRYSYRCGCIELTYSPSFIFINPMSPRWAWSRLGHVGRS